MGGEIILLNCCKWLQISSTFFTVRSYWFSGSEQLPTSDPPRSAPRLRTSDFRLWTFLDHNATTPVLPEVFEAMRPYFCEE